MHIQIVNYNLKGMSEGEFIRVCDELAPAFASVPGLVSKVWLADPSTNTYGTIYLWRDRQAMEAFARSELFQAMATNPHLANLSARDFAVLEGPTRVTRGVVAATV